MSPTPRLPRDTQLTCGRCGFQTRLTTAGFAAKALASHGCDAHLAAAERHAKFTARVEANTITRHCQHPGTPHAHGTHNAYVLDGCRCRTCRDTINAARRRNARHDLYGRPPRYIDVTPVREHLAALSAAGVGRTRIGELAGISSARVRDITRSKRITPDLAARLLKITPEAARPGMFIDGIGTRRRLQALMLRGFPPTWLGRRLAWPRVAMNHFLRRPGDHVSAGRARKVRDLYEELWNAKPPTDLTTGERRSLATALERAAREKWAPPAAWDEDLNPIDDPRSRPQGLGRTTTRDTYAAMLDNAAELAAAGLTRDAAAMQLGKANAEALMTALRRAGDLLDREADYLAVRERFTATQQRRRTSAA
jgi:hypothetical protein